MSAATVHRLHVAESAISAEQRERILSEARANIANKQNPTVAPIAPHRMEDPVAKWKREADEQEARAEREREQLLQRSQNENFVSEARAQIADLVAALGAVVDACERGSARLDELETENKQLRGRVKQLERAGKSKLILPSGLT